MNVNHALMLLKSLALSLTGQSVEQLAKDLALLSAKNFATTLGYEHNVIFALSFCVT